MIQKVDGGAQFALSELFVAREARREMIRELIVSIDFFRQSLCNLVRRAHCAYVELSRATACSI